MTPYLSDAVPTKLIYTVPSVDFVDAQIKGNDMGGSCDTYVEEERCIRSVGGETRDKETTWKTHVYVG